MTAQEKASAGLSLLKQAVLDYLGTRPEGAPSSEIRSALSIEDTDAEGQHKGYLLWGIEHFLMAEGKVEIDRNYRPQRLVLKR
jgi:hypothetical protein